jgi:hypothetical protein
VSRPDETEVYRFIVAFRRELPEIPDAPAHWRGWVMRVETQATGRPDEVPRRIWFTRLEQVPDVIHRLIVEARGAPSPPTDDGAS